VDGALVDVGGMRDLDAPYVRQDAGNCRVVDIDKDEAVDNYRVDSFVDDEGMLELVREWHMQLRELQPACGVLLDDVQARDIGAVVDIDEDYSTGWVCEDVREGRL